MGKYTFYEPPTCSVRYLDSSPEPIKGDEDNDWGAMRDATEDFKFVKPLFQWTLGEYKKLKEHLRRQELKKWLA